MQKGEDFCIQQEASSFDLIYIYYNNIIRQINSLNLNEENKNNIIKRLRTIQDEKDAGKAIKVIKKIYEIGKGIGLSILAKIICESFGIS